MTQQHERITPEGGGQSTAAHRQGKGKSKPLLDTPEIEAQKGNLGEALPIQNGAQQANQAGAAAGVARLGDQDSRVGRDISPGAQSGENLTRDEDKGVTEIVIEISQAKVFYAGSFLKDDGLPIFRFKSRAQQRPVMVQQGWNQQRFLHGRTSSNSIRMRH